MSSDTTIYEGPGSSDDWDLKMPGEAGYRTAEQVIAESGAAARVADRPAERPEVEGVAADVRSAGPSRATTSRQGFDPSDYSAGLELAKGPADSDDTDDPDGAGSAPAGSLLEEFRADLGKKVTPLHTAVVPGRPNIELVVRTDWSEETYRRWQAKAKDRRSDDGISNAKLVRAMLAQQTVRILFKGIVMTEDGVPWNFKHPACQREFGANTPEQAVDALIPSFPQLIAVGNDVSEAAGKGSLVGGDADPT